MDSQFSEKNLNCCINEKIVMNNVLKNFVLHIVRENDERAYPVKSDIKQDNTRKSLLRAHNVATIT